VLSSTGLHNTFAPSLAHKSLFLFMYSYFIFNSFHSLRLSFFLLIYLVCLCHIFHYFSFSLLLGAGIAQSVQRRIMGWMTGVRFPLGGKRFFSTPYHPDQFWSPISYPISIGSKGTEVKNGGAIPPLSHTPS
jgi:hypothetical protein